MAYLRIGSSDFSGWVNELKVSSTANYNAQTNAAGDTVVDYINHKRTIEAGFIPMDDAAMSRLMAAVAGFSVSLSFRNPQTNALETGVACIVPDAEPEYYTIQSGRVLYKALRLTFQEL